MTKAPSKSLTIHNGTVEFLIFTAQAGESGIEVRYAEETIWLMQKLMAELFGVERSVVTKHLKNIFKDGELDEESVEESVCVESAHTAADGKTYRTRFNAYLDLAEDRARRKIPMTVEDWAKRPDMFIELNDRKILDNPGTACAQAAKNHAAGELEKYRVIQDRLLESDFDRDMKALADAARVDSGEAAVVPPEKNAEKTKRRRR